MLVITVPLNIFTKLFIYVTIVENCFYCAEHIVVTHVGALFSAN